MKLTINLEDKLINSKKATIEKLNNQQITEEKLLLTVNNILYDEELKDREVLNSAGFGTAISNAESMVTKLQETTSIKNKLKDNRIFTELEIKNIAVGYGLRFLPTSYYIGVLDNQLPIKIKEAEEICKDNILVEYVHTDEGYKPQYYILAPKSSFKLDIKPKDPLLFLKLTDGTFYLVHKWGDDLSIFRYIANLFKRNEWILLALQFCLLLFFGNMIYLFKDTHIPLFVTILIILTFTVPILGDWYEKTNNKTWKSYYE